MYSARSLNMTRPTSTSIIPDSILEISRISLINSRRSDPDEWIVRANSRCLSVRFSSLSASSFARISMLLSGVRSSCDIFARNSDLYFEVTASCSAFSCRARLARSIRQFFRSHRCRDRVEHDTDRFGELIEERQVDIAESLERCELDDRLHLAFEQDRQNDNVQRRRLAQTGIDLNVIGWDIGQQDAILL